MTQPRVTRRALRGLPPSLHSLRRMARKLRRPAHKLLSGVAVAGVLLTAVAGNVVVNPVQAQAAAPFPIDDFGPGSNAGSTANWDTPQGFNVSSTTDGWIRLTAAAEQRKANMLMKQSFPSTTGFEVSMDYRMGGGTGADGLAMYLVDGGAPVSMGAPGSGLGYAGGPNPATPNQEMCGVTGGYLGVGLDAYGNFSANFKNAVNPGGKATPNSVVLRGSGSTQCAQSQALKYPYITGKTVAGLQTKTSGDPARDGNSEYRRVQLTVEPLGGDMLHVQVSLSQAFKKNQPVNSAFTKVLDTKIGGAASGGKVDPLPATLKLGISASTGGATNYHDIRNVSIRALADASAGAAMVTTPTNAAEAAYAPGDTVSYELTGTNAGPSMIGDAATGGTARLAHSVVGLENVKWTCEGLNGAICEQESGEGAQQSSGDVSALEPGTSPDIAVDWSGPAGSSIKVTVTGTAVNNPTPGTYTYTPKVVIPNDFTSNTVVGDGFPVQQDGGAVDPRASNNTATTAFKIVVPAELPSISSTLTIDPDQYAQVGDELTAKVTITNTGNVPLSDVKPVAGAFTGAGSISAYECPVTTLQPGEEVVCTATITVAEGDLNTGSITANASAVGTPAKGAKVTSPETSDAATLNESPALTITANPKLPAELKAGDSIPVTFEVTNTGNSPLAGVGVTGASTTGGTLSGVTCAPTNLPVGAKATCTADYTVTQDEITNGKLHFTASATGTTPGGKTADASVTDGTSVDLTSLQHSSATVELTAKPVEKTNNETFAAGDEIEYTYTVTNTGNTPIVDPTITDAEGKTVACAPNPLQPGATATCVITKPVTQDMVEAKDPAQMSGTLTGTAAGKPVEQESNVVETPFTQNSGIELKLAGVTLVDDNGDGKIAAGDSTKTTVTVQNTGTLTLTGGAVTDTLGSNYTCEPAGDIAPGASVTCEGTAKLTQGDIDAGSVETTATATGATSQEAKVTSNSVTGSATIERKPSLTVTAVEPKVTDVDNDGRTAVGDTIDYTFTVTNDGTTSLTGTTVTSPGLAGVTCVPTDLAPGASATCTATHTVTQDDVDRGSIIVTPNGAANSPSGAVTGVGPEQTVELTQESKLDLTFEPKLNVSEDSTPVAGDTITVTYSPKNSGTTTLTGVEVTDPRMTDIECTPAQLGQGVEATCTATYVLTQEDIDRGHVEFAPEATATGVAGGTETAKPEAKQVDLKQETALSVVAKSATVDPGENTLKDTGDTATFVYTVTNDGNVTAKNVTVRDEARDIDVTCEPSELAPGASATCSYTAKVKQSEVNAGEITSQVTASSTSSAGDATSEEASQQAELDAKTGITVTPEEPVITDADGRVKDGPPAAGDTIRFPFVVENVGTTTVGDIVLSDPELGELTCEANSLDAGKTMTCYVDRPVTQEDVDSTPGKTITAMPELNAKDPKGPIAPVAPEKPTGVKVDQTSTLSVVEKSVVHDDKNGNKLKDSGDPVTFTYTVTNTGKTTVTDVVVTDAAFGKLECAPLTLAPGESAECSITTPMTQTNVNVGEIVSSVTAAGSSVTGSVAGDKNATQQLDADQKTGITVTPETPKVTGPNGEEKGDGPAVAGDVIEYTFTVENIGTTTVGDIELEDPVLGKLTCEANALDAGATMTCTVTHTVTQEDVDKKPGNTIQSNPTLTGTDPNGKITPVNPEKPASVVLEQESVITVSAARTDVADENGNSLKDTGDLVSFTYTVTNDGTTTLNGVEITDELFGTVSCGTEPLAPGESVECTVTVPMTQADVDAGVILSKVNASASSVVGPTESERPAEQSVAADQNPGLIVTPKTPAVTGADGSDKGEGPAVAGDVITYEFEIENVGTTTVGDIVLEDPLLGTITCETTKLAAGEKTTCTATHTVTQDEVDEKAGKTIVTGPIVTGTSPKGDNPKAPIDPFETPKKDVELVQQGKLVVSTAKPVVTDTNGNGLTDAGDEVAYVFTVKNEGTTTAKNVQVTDPMLAKAGVTVTCDPTDIAPGASATCTATPYTVTQADVDGGLIEVTPAADSTDVNGALTASGELVEVAPDQTKGLQVAAAGNTQVDANGNELTDRGDEITFSYEITNTGTTSVSNLEIVDEAFGPLTCDVTELAPGETIVCTVTTTVTQAEVNAGTIESGVTATGDTTIGQAASERAAQSVEAAQKDGLIVTPQAPKLLDKDGNPLAEGEKPAAGDKIEFTFDVENVGTTTIGDIVLNDPKLGEITCVENSLDAGGKTTCTVTYTVTQDDVDGSAGTVIGNPVAEGKNPKGDEYVSPSPKKPAVAELDQQGAITVSAADPVLPELGEGELLQAGDPVSYTFTVTNTGVTTATNVTVTDPMLAKAGVVISCEAPTDSLRADAPLTLAPGASTVCTATYPLTQEDIDRGIVEVTPKATGTDVRGGLEADGNTVKVEPAQGATLSVAPVEVTVADENGNELTDTGDTAKFSYRVTNTGNTTLTGVTVEDAVYGTLTCDPITLKPGESADCFVETTITQAQVDEGIVPSSVTAKANAPESVPAAHRPQPVEASQQTPATQVSGLTVSTEQQSPVDVNDNGKKDAGDTIEYVFTVTNTGTTTMTDVAVTDPLFTEAGETVTCAPTTLRAGESAVCRVTHVVTQAEVDAQDPTITVAATATGSTTIAGEPKIETPVSAPVATELDQVGGLAVAVQGEPVHTDVTGDGLRAAGDTLSYVFTVKNEGTTTVHDVTVTDPMLAAAGVTVECLPTTLAPGESAQCVATPYTMTQADVDAGIVSVTPEADGADVRGALEATGAVVEVKPERVNELAVTLDPSSVIDANGNELSDAGDEINYVFNVTNTGTTTMTDVSVTDPKLAAAGVTITCDPTTLAPGETAICVATPYTVTQADVDGGEIKITGTATGVGPDGETAEAVVSADNATEVTLPLSQQSELAVLKTVSKTKFEAGDELVFVIAAKNVGTVTVENVVLKDTNFSGTGKLSAPVCGDLSSLAPGESASCEYRYTATAADQAAGTLTNGAEATGALPGGAGIVGTSAVSVEALPVKNALAQSGASGLFGIGLAGTGVALMTAGVVLFLARRNRAEKEMA